MMNSLRPVFFSAVKVAPISMLILLSLLQDGPSNFGEFLLFILVGSMITGVIALVAGGIIFTIIVNIHVRKNHESSLQIFIKYLPIFVFTFGLFLVVSLLAFQLNDYNFLHAFATSAYLSSVIGWYFFSTDYYKNLIKP